MTKVKARRLPKLEMKITHCVFVNPDMSLCPHTGKVENTDRVLNLNKFNKLGTVTVAVMMLNAGEEIIDNIVGRVSNKAQFLLLLDYFKGKRKQLGVIDIGEAV